MTDQWTISQTNFTNDDESHPGIEFPNLATESVSALFEYFRSRWRIVPDGATLHDNTCKADVRLNQFMSAAEMVVAGVAKQFPC